MSVNKVILIGRLGRDPEIRYTSGGSAVANIAIATDESYKDKTSGEKVKKTEWHRLTVWGPSVENFVQKYIHKGDLIYVEGKLQTREWVDKNQVTRSTTEINVTDIKGIQTGESNQAPANPPAQRAAAPAKRSQQEIDDDLSDIPF